MQLSAFSLSLDKLGTMPVGNCLSLTTQQDVVNYQYDDANRLVMAGDVSVGWDNNGNMTSFGSRTYTYDHANRLTQVVSGTLTTEFTYNGVGDRVRKTVDGVTTHYVLDPAAGLTQVLQETTNGQTTSYLYGHDLLAQYDSGTWAYHVNDGLGSVRQLADPMGQVVQGYSFSPFGVPLGESGGDPYGYTGEQWDGEAEVLYLRARMYQPEMGRFISSDPWPGDMSSPQSLNRYSYVENDPINATDPSGLFRFANATHEYHQRIEDAWYLQARTFRHVEFPILGAGVGGRAWRADMITSAGAVFELEPHYNQAAGLREVRDKLRALRLARGQYTTGAVDWNTLQWHFGTKPEFGSIVRVKLNPYYDLVADWIADGLVVYWAEPRRRLPVYVPIPEQDQVGKRLRKRRGWHPLNPQLAPQPAYTIQVVETCGKIIVYTGGAVIVLTLVEDILSGGVGVIDDAITVPGGLLLISWGNQIAAWAQQWSTPAMEYIQMAPAMAPAIP